jgi:hypothetical protein
MSHLFSYLGWIEDNEQGLGKAGKDPYESLKDRD